MPFVFAVFLTYWLTLPGIYLICRSRLASTRAESICAGFFLGIGLVVLGYLWLAPLTSVGFVDVLINTAALMSLVLLVKDSRGHNLPWLPAFTRTQAIVFITAFLFMLTLTFGALAKDVDDDIFIHLPNIQRIAMGDVPPHVPYFPDTYLRGHTGRDVFTGAVAKMLQLRPELAIVYVTLAASGMYILMFYALALRLARADRIATPFTFFGLLFLVSCAVGESQIRAGSITYVLNNNTFAYGYAAFVGWLIDRVCSAFQAQSATGLLAKILQNKLIIGLCACTYAALYFIYISNFLMFSLFMAFIPALAALAVSEKRWRNFVHAGMILALIVGSAVVLHVFCSPFMLERIAVSLHRYHPAEPMGLVQQAQLTFPKPLPFTITDRSGADFAFLTWPSLTAQGLSFYIGLAGVFVGLWTRRISLVATSLFGWNVMLWLLLVDMGDFRAETLRLLLIGHMAFGAATGLMFGLAVNRIMLVITWVREAVPIVVPAIAERVSGLFARIAMTAVVIVAISANLWMARGSFEKIANNGSWNIASSIQQMSVLHRKDPENWHHLLNMPLVDAQTFQVVKEMVHDPSKRILLKLEQDKRFIGIGHPVNKIAQMVNAASITGAGIAGICVKHRPPQMDFVYLLYDYRSSLFWQCPTQQLLAQLAPDWIIVDPSLVPAETFNKVAALPGVSIQRTITDGAGRKRIILQYKKNDLTSSKSAQIASITPDAASVDASLSTLASVPVVIDMKDASDKPAVGMLIQDDRGQPVNLCDMPILPVRKTGQNRYELCFSMVQQGNWNVYFVDPVSRRRLNQLPLLVKVHEAPQIVSTTPDHLDKARCAIATHTRTE